MLNQYRVTFQVTGEFSEVVNALSADQAIKNAQEFVEETYAVRWPVQDIQVVKVEQE